MPISLRKAFYMSLLAALVACASVDFDYPKTESTAVDSTGDTFLGQRYSELVAEHPGESGLMPEAYMTAQVSSLT